MPEPIEIDEKGNIILKLNLKRSVKVIIILFLAWMSYQLPIPGMTESARICLMVFVGAAGLWITEAIPPFATAIMVVVLNIYLLARPSELLQSPSEGLNYQVFLNPIASPVLVLFFGGFIMALAATKHGLDLRLAKAFLKPFGTKPSMVLLGVILTTATFSMFMSNTATTAMMFAIFAPMVKTFEERDAFKKALVLSIPFAANIGGMGTIIGTPPNAVAASVLEELGYPVSFIKWMVIGIPIVIVMLFILWVILLRMFKPKKQHFEILFPEQLQMTWDLLLVTLTFTITVLLWISEPLHHIPAAVVALLPVMIFTMFGIIDGADLKKIEWDVLILVAGGMSLGVSMKNSGLSDVLIGQISFGELPVIIILVIIAVVTILVSNFMSHTSAANLLIPIVASLAVVFPPVGALTVAFAASLAMSLPISTPPNAIAFSTREIKTKEMAKSGTLISFIGMLVIVAVLMLIRCIGVF